MKVPTLHLNGSGPGLLTKQLDDVRQALTAALEALSAATPHDRDYYVQSAQAGVEARHDHLGRMARVQSVLEEIEDIHQAVYVQVLDREARRSVATTA